MTKTTINDNENTEQLSNCACHHSKKIALLPDKKLNEEYELACGCESTTLKNLLKDFECSECGEACYYCFCKRCVLDSNSMRYCDICRKCREDSEWHCARCNKCTYGLTLACENCGKKSPYRL